MTREQAIENVRRALAGPAATGVSELLDAPAVGLVDALAALGLMKFDEPRQKLHRVPVINAGGGDITATILEDTLIKTMRDAGYEVTKRWP